MVMESVRVLVKALRMLSKILRMIRTILQQIIHEIYIAVRNIINWLYQEVIFLRFKWFADTDNSNQGRYGRLKLSRI